jgi:glycine betaine/proline transport system ATP-binding protein
MADGLASIQFRNVSKVFGPRADLHLGDVRAGVGKAELLDRHNHVLGLKDVTLDIESGHIQVVMGLSGSGKSTLIRHINRLIDPTDGEVIVGGVDVLKLKPEELRVFRRRMTAMVFQKFALLPHRTVVGNVVFGLEIQGVPAKQQQETARRWISRVGLDGFEDKYPSQLSGGMQQRVGLARALTNDAPILLMDEAFSALDPLIRVDMQTILLDLQAEVQKTVVFITHDLDEALTLGDRVAILHDGELVQQGRPQDIVLRPADAYVESFVRHVNRARVLKLGGLAGPAIDGAVLELPATLTLAEAAARLVDVGESIATVTGRTGRAIGGVRLEDLVAAIVKS